MGELIKRETVLGAALLALTLVVFYLFYRIIIPFFASIVWAIRIIISKLVPFFTP